MVAEIREDVVVRKCVPPGGVGADVCWASQPLEPYLQPLVPVVVCDVEVKHPPITRVSACVVLGVWLSRWKEPIGCVA